MAGPAGAEQEVLGAGHGADEGVPVGGRVVGAAPAADEGRVGEGGEALGERAADGGLVAVEQWQLTVVAHVDHRSVGLVGDHPDVAARGRAHDDVRDGVAGDRGGSNLPGRETQHGDLDPHETEGHLPDAGEELG